MSNVVLAFPKPRRMKDRAADKNHRASHVAGGLKGLILGFAPRRHILLAVMSVTTAPILYLTLEAPKWIVNGALVGDVGALPLLLKGMGPHCVLVALCVLQLAALAALSAIKFATNVLSANLGERMLRHLRLEVFRGLRSAPESRDGGMAPVLTQEFEAIAGFAGGAIAVPIGQLTAFLTVIGFLLMQDWRLAVAALALTPLQVLIVPRLLRKISVLKRARIAAVRDMCATVSSDRGFNSALRDARRAQDLRFDIHSRKFAMKAIYNFIGHMTPLSFLSVGGWLVLSGDLSLGALVAAIAAYREAAGPMRELFSYYVRWADARTRYRAVQTVFDQAEVAKLAA